MDEVSLDWAWHKRTLSASPASASTSDVRRIDVPKPDTYDGTRNATIVDNFLFGLDQYFDAMGVRDEASKVGERAYVTSSNHVSFGTTSTSSLPLY